MKLPRSSIVMLMCVVGIVALNLAVGRVIYQDVPWKLAGIGLIGVVLQVGFFCLICSQGRPRLYAFWAGVEFGGVVGLWSFLHARVPDSWVGSLWEEYAEFIDVLLSAHFGLSVLDRGPEDPVLLATVAIFAFLPQLLMTLGGGLLGLSLAWSARARASVFTLFAIVGILVLNLAVWLAAWNALPAQPPWLPFGVTPGGLLLQLGLFGLIRSWSRTRSRAFWVGFVAVGSLVFWSYLRAMIFTHIQTARYFMYWPNGPWYARPTSEAPLWTLWIDYTALASYLLGRPPYGTYIVAWTNNPIDSLAYALIVLLPHWLAALGGGVLAIFVMWVADIRHRGTPMTA
jgi:hypothetical protein